MQASVKIENVILDLNASLRPLKPHYVVALDRTIAATTISRAMFTAEYGGGSMAIFPKISDKNLARHGLDNFMFIKLDYNPNAPLNPGESGFFFGEVSQVWKRGKVRLFVRIDSGEWRYMGWYDPKPTPPLTTEEWKNQKPAVRF